MIFSLCSGFCCTKYFTQNRITPIGTMMLAITLTINIKERQISLFGFLKYFAPALIFVAKLSIPTCSTCAFALPDTTKLPDITLSPTFLSIASGSPVIRLSFTSTLPSTMKESAQI